MSMTLPRSSTYGAIEDPARLPEGAACTLDVAIVCAQQFVGAVLNPAGDVGIGRAALGRIVFEAAIFGRIVRRGDDDSVGERLIPVRL